MMPTLTPTLAASGDSSVEVSPLTGIFIGWADPVGGSRMCRAAGRQGTADSVLPACSPDPHPKTPRGGTFLPSLQRRQRTAGYRRRTARYRPLAGDGPQKDWRVQASGQWPARNGRYLAA